jgi:hypothetical protein
MTPYGEYAVLSGDSAPLEQPIKNRPHCGVKERIGIERHVRRFYRGFVQGIGDRLIKCVLQISPKIFVAW